jgi:hypothetical protein
MCAALGLLMAGPAVNAQAAADDTAIETTTNEIEVQGQRMLDKSALGASLRKMIAPIRMFDVVPRYEQTFCIAVDGLEPEANQLIKDRIVQTALNVGLRAARPKCRVNAVVMIVDDPKKTFDLIHRRHTALLGSINSRDIHTRTIVEQLEAGRPFVNWNSLSNGPPLMFDDIFTGFFPVRGMAFRDAGRHIPKQMSVIMFDRAQLEEASLGQVADFASLYLLGMPRRQIDFDNVAVTSVLSLFADGPQSAPAQMTEFDAAYLAGLYKMPRNNRRTGLYSAVVRAYEMQCADPDVPCQIRLEG